MELELLATCSGGGCPTVFVDASPVDDADIVVQGYSLASSGVGVAVPDGESLVRIPRAILLAAAERLTATP